MSTEAQRSSLQSLLVEEEDWLYMEADEGEGAQQFVDHLEKVKATAEPIKKRAEVRQYIFSFTKGAYLQ